MSKYILLAVFLVLVLAVLRDVLLKFTSKQIGTSSAKVINITSSGHWSGYRAVQVKLYCMEYDVSQIITVPNQDDWYKGKIVNVNVIRYLDKTHAITYDFEQKQWISLFFYTLTTSLISSSNNSTTTLSITTSFLGVPLLDPYSSSMSNTSSPSIALPNTA